jgi:hypothetical protein
MVTAPLGFADLIRARRFMDAREYNRLHLIAQSKSSEICDSARLRAPGELKQRVLRGFKGSFPTV